MIKKILIRVGIGFTGLVILTTVVMLSMSIITAKPMYNEKLIKGTGENIEIYGTDRALTFARYRENNSIQLMLVESYIDGVVTGININSLNKDVIADPIDFFNEYGYEGIISLVKENSAKVNIETNRLIKPVNFENNNIAAGYNYKSHVVELDEDEPPFLYPKKVEPDNFNTTINIKNYSLPDYELELGIVLLDDVTTNSKNLEYFGFILVNDFSDRLPIVQKHMNVIFGKYDALPDGVQGYSTAKNRENACPTGNLFVIPRDYRDFLNNTKLKLYLNGELRQVANPQDIIWGPEKIIDEIFLRREWAYETENEDWYLLEKKDIIPSGTILLTGTPKGVIFKKTNMWNSAVFLQQGDEILLVSDGLGIINNRIIKD